MRSPTCTVTTEVRRTANSSGSTSLATDAEGGLVSRQLYTPYGEGTLPTDYGFTGQRKDGTIKLLHYNARFYDPWLARFVSADTIVPSAGSPQSLNRYSYVYSRPLVYVDPDGHLGIPIVVVVGLIAVAVMLVSIPGDTGPYEVTGHPKVFQCAFMVAGICAAGVADAPGVGVTSAGTAKAVGEAATTAAAGELLDGEFADEQAAYETVKGAVQTIGDPSDEMQAMGQASGPLAQQGQQVVGQTAQRTILWMEHQTGRVGKIMAPKHGWDRLITLSGDVLQDYQAVQPHIQQAIASGGTQINSSSLGPVMQYVATVNGEQVVVRGIELANGAVQVSDAWVVTP